MESLILFFTVDHLPENLKIVVAPFRHLAEKMYHEYPRNAESTTAMRKLLEAKDCAVRAYLLYENGRN